ncbi:MAG: hypothetical protein QM608_20040 [Caulobacter sp.]
MISSAEEFVRLRESGDPEEYGRAAWSEAPIEVWRDVIARFPEMRFWVAQNKSVPLEILRDLAVDEDAGVRWMVAARRKLDRPLFELLLRDSDHGVIDRLVVNTKAPADIRDAAREKLAALRAAYAADTE